MVNPGKKPGSANVIILVPIDFSTVTENALVHALEIAQHFQYSVCMLHVYNPPANKTPNRHDPALQTIRDRLLHYKTEFEKKYTVTVESLIREGNLFKAVNVAVADIKPGLMVMGTHGKQGLQQLYGSYALRMVLDSSCPVMVVQDKPAAKGYPGILLPVNGETDPARMVEWVSRFSKMSTPEVHLFQSREIIPDRAESTGRITLQITGALKERKIHFVKHMAGSSSDFSRQVLDHANATGTALILTMTMPEPDASGYNFSDWNERLMFNPGKIPVMFLDKADFNDR
jgi:nucleotide-binding universal stress UspA family protein